MKLKQEDFDWLFQAMSCYLPYGLMVGCEDLEEEPLQLDGLQTGPMLLFSSDYEDGYQDHDFGYHVLEDDFHTWQSAYQYLPKPYLMTLEDLTDEEMIEYDSIENPISRHLWLLENHVDIFELLSNDMAIRVTEENNPY